MSRTLKWILLAIALLSGPAKILSQEGNNTLPPTIANPFGDGRSTPPAPSSSSVEHWDKLSIRDNNLHPDPPLSGETDSFPRFTRELLRVQWRGGDPIDLYIVRPTGVARPPMIVYVYGYPGEAVRFLNNSLCETMTRNGYAAVGFSSMMTGQRYHDVPMKEWFVSNLRQALVGTTHDVQMVLNYLDSRGDFDMRRVGMFGEGSGGTIALLTASVEPRIKAVDVLNPWGDWPAWLSASRMVPDGERSDLQKPLFLEDVASLDPVTFLPTLTRLPLRVQQNLWDDTMTPASARQRIAAALPPGALLERYKDKEEYLNKVGRNGKMLDWLYAHLGSGEGRSLKGYSPKVGISARFSCLRPAQEIWNCWCGVERFSLPGPKVEEKSDEPSI